MSNMTAEDYKDHFDHGLIPFILESTNTYGDLRAKEAVKEFAEALIDGYAMYYGQVPMVTVDEIKHVAKQKGVEI